MLAFSREGGVCYSLCVSLHFFTNKCVATVLSVSLFLRMEGGLSPVYSLNFVLTILIYIFADVFSCPPFMSLQLNRQRVFDRFKTRENTFFDKLEDDLFQSLYEMKEFAHKTYLLAMKWGIGPVKMELWRSHANFVQRIIDNVAYRSHGWVARELKAHFGGEEDLSKKDNKAAKRIIREASRPHNSMVGMPQHQNMGMAWAPQFVPPPMMGMNMPTQYFPMPQQMQGPAGSSGSFGGICFKCNQPGHMARACPMALMRGFQGGGGGGRRPFGGRPFKRGKRA